jgi:hypothetical protein
MRKLNDVYSAFNADLHSIAQWLVGARGAVFADQPWKIPRVVGMSTTVIRPIGKRSSSRRGHHPR